MKSPTRIAQAEARRRVLEDQLEDSKYGVGYIDSTEHITQLNRAIENDLPQQIDYLTNQLYSQIGIGPEVFNGTANPQQMLIYNKKVLKPILDTIELEFTRKFLTPTARTQGQRVTYYIDAFDLVTVDEVANMANAFSRNEILSSNEVRAILGFKPNDDPRSDQLINKNMPINQVDPDYAQNPNDDTEDVDADLDELQRMLDEEDIGDEESESERILNELSKQLGE